MKIFGLCFLVAGSVFVVGLLPWALYQSGAGKSTIVPNLFAEKKPAPKAKFPEALVPAAQAHAVPEAALFQAGPDAHKIVFVWPTGEVHPWQEKIPEDWQAESVEETELVMVVGKQKKRFVQKITYANNAPPIDRYSFEAEVSAIEAKTGKILAHRLFRNVPREVRGLESWETTLIGRVVEWPAVFQWVAAQSKLGFPHEEDPAPIEKVVQ